MIDDFSEFYTQKKLVNWFQTKQHTVIEGCIDNPILFNDITDCKTDDKFGIDVVAKRETDLWIVEVKGETKGGRSSAVSNFHYGLGQIFTRMTCFNENIHYGLAMPNTDNFAFLVRKIMDLKVLERLNLSLILIGKEKIVFIN